VFRVALIGPDGKGKTAAGRGIERAERPPAPSSASLPEV
jgi:hypothetical protein